MFRAAHARTPSAFDALFLDARDDYRPLSENPLRRPAEAIDPAERSGSRRESTGVP